MDKLLERRGFDWHRVNGGKALGRLFLFPWSRHSKPRLSSSYSDTCSY